VGSCIAEDVARGLSSTEESSNRFEFIPIPLHIKRLDDPDVLRGPGSIRVRSGRAIGHTDLINAARNPHSDVFCFPYAVLRSIWPFDGASGYVDPSVSAIDPGAAAHQHDGALARLREIEPNKKRRLERYRNLDFDIASRIERTFEAQERFLTSIDAGNDVYLGRFISRHYRDRQLFYNSTHPSEVVFQELCEFIWQKLEIPTAPPLIHGLDAWKIWGVPVHPQIARRLRLTWALEDTRYAFGSWGQLLGMSGYGSISIPTASYLIPR
jgi:hypothetical protein